MAAATDPVGVERSTAAGDGVDRPCAVLCRVSGAAADLPAVGLAVSFGRFTQYAAFTDCGRWPAAPGALTQYTAGGPDVAQPANSITTVADSVTIVVRAQ